MHLFDIDIPGGIRFQESEVLTPGDDFFTFDTGILGVIGGRAMGKFQLSFIQRLSSSER